MKRVIHIDKSGFKRVYAIRDNDDPSKAHQGIPIGPPDLRVLDWDEIVKELNNALVDSGVITIEDLNINNSGITAALTSIVRKRIINLYKEFHKE